MRALQIVDWGTMANILLVCAEGRRQAQVEVAATRAGHRVYAAGSAQEALRMAETYVPDVVLVSPYLPTSEAASVADLLRSSKREMVRDLPIVSPQAVCTRDSRSVRLTKGGIDRLLATLDQAIRMASPPA